MGRNGGKKWHVWIVRDGYLGKQVFCFKSQMSARRWAKDKIEGKEHWKVRECRPEQGGVCKAPPTRAYDWEDEGCGHCGICRDCNE